MPIVEVGNAEIEFPDDMSPDEIKAVLRNKFPPQESALSNAAVAQQPLPEMQQQPKGFLERVGDAYDERIKKGENIAEQYVEGKQSYPETLAQFGGQGAAFGSDVAIEGLKSLGNAVKDITPEFIKQGLASGLGYVSNTPLGRTVGGAASEGADYAIQKYGDFSQEYPRAARNVEAAANIGLSLTPAVRVGGKSIASTAESVAKKGLETGADIANKAVSPILPEISPGATEIVQLAQKYKIPVSLPQVSDSRALANIQKISQELPLSGSGAFRDKQLLSWQRQLFESVGMKADRFTPKTMAAAFKKVGGEFDNLTKGKNFNIANDFVDNLAKKQDEIYSLYGDDAAKAFQREALKVFSDFNADGTILGDKLAFHRARVNGLARKAVGANKEALQDLESIIVDGITSKDPALAKALSSAKEKYKNLIVIEPLARRAKKGFINPTLLNNRVAKIYGRAYTTGNAGKIGDLARIGYELLGELGGSDTAQKLLYMAGTSGGAALVGLPLTAGAIGLNRGMQSGLLRNQALIKMATTKAEKKQLKEIMKMEPEEAKKLLEELE